MILPDLWQVFNTQRVQSATEMSHTVFKDKNILPAHEVQNWVKSQQQLEPGLPDCTLPPTLPIGWESCLICPNHLIDPSLTIRCYIAWGRGGACIQGWDRQESNEIIIFYFKMTEARQDWGWSSSQWSSGTSLGDVTETQTLHFQCRRSLMSVIPATWPRWLRLLQPVLDWKRSLKCLDLSNELQVKMT